MPTPLLEDRPSPSHERMHLFLAERGSAILPEGVDADGHVGLTDAMLVVAALAVCFALARESLPLGLVALVVAFPALVRTHVVMARARGLGESPGVFGWLAAFASSTARMGLVLGLISVIHAVSLAIGWSIGAWLGVGPLPAGPPKPGIPPPAAIPWMSPTLGAVLGFLLIGVPLMLVALAMLYPRLIAVRDGIRADRLRNTETM